MLGQHPLSSQPLGFYGLVPGPGLAGDFCAIVEERVLVQIDNAPDQRQLRDMLCVMSEQLERYRDMAVLISEAFNIPDADGQQLDMIGAVLGMPREGWLDARYRVFLRIQIALLLSAARDDAAWTGTSENLIAIARALIGPTLDAVMLSNQPPYEYTLTVPEHDPAETPLLVRLLRTATYAGVLGQLIVLLGDDSRWASDSVVVDGGGIWASASVTVSGAAVWSAAYLIQ